MSHASVRTWHGTNTGHHFFARAMWDAAASAEPVELSKPATILAALRLPWTSKYMPDWADPTHKWLHETTVPLRDFDFSYDVN